jgi:hypothetical protein
MPEAYSDDQMLEAVANAAKWWAARAEASGRGEITRSDETRTAIVVLDFDEIAELREAIADRPGKLMLSALYDEFSDWLLDAGPMVEPAGDPAA